MFNGRSSLVSQIAAGLLAALCLAACSPKIFQELPISDADEIAAISSTGGGAGGTGGGGGGAPVNQPPTITPAPDRLYPLDGTNEPLVQRTSYTLTSTAVDPEGNNPVTFTDCTYETVGLSASDPNYAPAGTACTSLPSYATTNGALIESSATFSGGALSWTPRSTQRGTYKFTVTARDSLNETSSASFSATVREDLPASAMLLGLESTSSAGDNQSDWLSIIGSLFADLSQMLASPWAGNGTSSNPYALAFNGSSDHMMIASPFGNSTKLRWSAWIKPASVATQGSVILTNASGSHGFTLMQSFAAQGVGKLILTRGTSLTTYSNAVLADSPKGYWHLEEGNGPVGPTFVDSSGANFCGGPCTIDLENPAPTLQQPSVTNKFGYSVDVIPNTWLLGPYNFAFTDGNNTDQPFSVEAWIYLNPGRSGRGAILSKYHSNDSRNWIFGVNTSNELFFRHFHRDNANIYIGRRYSTPLQTGSWYHVVGTYSASETAAGIKLYVNGVQVDNANDSAGAYTGFKQAVGRMVVGDCWDSSSYIGSDPAGCTSLNGRIDEPAIYSGVLSAARIQAHYEAAHSYAISNEALANNDWIPVSAVFDGTKYELYVGSSLQDSFSPPSYDPTPGTQLTVGSAANGSAFWNGSASQLITYGTEDGSSPGTASDLLGAVHATSEKFRSAPIGPVHLDDLILHADAANAARNGASAFPAGSCAANTRWYDLLGSFVSSGTLVNFNCAAEGWQGTGTAVDPFVVKGGATDHYVDFGAIDALSFTDGAGNDQPFSIEAWVTFNSFANAPAIAGKAAPGAHEEYYVEVDASGRPRLALINSGSAYGTGRMVRQSGSALSTGTWYQLVFTYSGSETNSGIKIYINGSEPGSYTTDNLGPYAGMGKHASSLVLGARSPSDTTHNVNGSIAITRIYSAALTPEQVRQNCHAQKARFSGVVCTAP